MSTLQYANFSVEKYNRLVATRGEDYLLVYNYTGRPMQIDLTRSRGAKKKAWWYSPVTGQYTYIGEFMNRVTKFIPAVSGVGQDVVLVVTDSVADYVKQKNEVEDQKNLEE